MVRRAWEPAWDAYRAAEQDYQLAVEAFRQIPPGDEPGRSSVLDAGRKRTVAWDEFSRLFDEDQFHQLSVLSAWSKARLNSSS